MACGLSVHFIKQVIKQAHEQNSTEIVTYCDTDHWVAIDRTEVCPSPCVIIPQRHHQRSQRKHHIGQAVLLLYHNLCSVISLSRLENTILTKANTACDSFFISVPTRSI